MVGMSQNPNLSWIPCPGQRHRFYEAQSTQRTLLAPYILTSVESSSECSSLYCLYTCAYELV